MSGWDVFFSFFFFVGEKALGEHPDVCAGKGRGLLRRPQQLEFREYHLFWSLHTFELFNKAVKKKSHLCFFTSSKVAFFSVFWIHPKKSALKY